MPATERRKTLKGTPEKPLRAVFYLRQSDESRGEETISDEIQRRACQQWCENNNATLVKITDGLCKNGEIWEQKTGRIWFKRKGVQAAMRLIKEDKADIIVLWRWNRLSRRPKHWAIAEQLFDEIGGQAVSATEPADLNTKEGRFSKGIHILIAELESDGIGETWQATHEIRRGRGLPASGGKKFGYRLVREKGEEERYEILDEEADAVRWMYDAFIEGKTVIDIMKYLNAHDIPNTRGSTWKYSATQSTLDSGFAAGLLMRTYWENEKVIVPRFSEREWLKGAHKPIIDAETWQLYKDARLARTYRRTPSRVASPMHFLAGLVRCGDCNGPMHRQPSTREVPSMVCTRWKEDRTLKCVTCSYPRLVRHVKAWLAEVAEEVEREAELIELATQRRLRVRSTVKDIEKEIIELDRKLAKLTMRNLAGDIPDAAYEATIGPLTAERTQADERLLAAKTEAAEGASEAPRQVVVELLRDWDILPITDRRNILASLIKCIEVFPPERRGRKATFKIHPTWAA